jgi:hypothetical protein
MTPAEKVVSEMKHNRENGELRDRSGTICSDDKVVALLYVLMRDHVTPGVVEELVRTYCHDFSTIYTNGYLAKYAKDLANRLK